MTITWIFNRCANKGHLYEDGICEDGLVAFSLYQPPRCKYWQLKVLTFFNRSLYFTSVEAAKKAAHEMVNKRYWLKID